MSLSRVYTGDALTMLRDMPEASVDCCVTSPPYWGLRDYGTATWEGGKDDCSHLKKNGTIFGPPSSTFNNTGNYDPYKTAQYAGTCVDCGAVRIDQQIGLEPSPHEYIAKLVAVFDEVRRVLKPSGTCWIVIGDSYASGMSGYGAAGGSYEAERRQWTEAPKREKRIIPNGIKPKDLCGIPWRLAFALQDRGWWLRQDIIWAKPNPMPESVTDRCTRSHEYVFLLTKAARYYYDAKAIAEPFVDDRMGNPGVYNSKLKGVMCGRGSLVFGIHGAAIQGNGWNADGAITGRNMRDVWSIQTEPYAKAHFATFPTKLVERCILAGSPHDGVVLDPFAGCGTTGEVAVKLGRRAVLIELNPEYVEMIQHNLGLFRCDYANTH